MFVFFLLFLLFWLKFIHSLWFFFPSLSQLHFVMFVFVAVYVSESNSECDFKYRLYFDVSFPIPIPNPDSNPIVPHCQVQSRKKQNIIENFSSRIFHTTIFHKIRLISSLFSHSNKYWFCNAKWFGDFWRELGIALALNDFHSQFVTL